MGLTFEFYTARAKAAEEAADGAELANVRERELRSAKAWRDMANRALLVEAERAKADAERAGRRAAELAAVESEPGPEG